MAYIIYLVSPAHAIWFSKCHIFMGAVKSHTRNQMFLLNSSPIINKTNLIYKISCQVCSQKWSYLCPEFSPEYKFRQGRGLCEFYFLSYPKRQKDGLIQRRQLINIYLLVEYSKQVCHWPEPASLVKMYPFRNSLCGEQQMEKDLHKGISKPKMISFCVFQRPI